VKYADTTCPFCGETLETKACAPSTVHAMTRAALVFASATAVAACGTGSPAYGGFALPISDDAGSDAGTASSSGLATPADGGIGVPVNEDAGANDAGTSGNSSNGGSGPAYGGFPGGGGGTSSG
jgi:hypothetical protein